MNEKANQRLKQEWAGDFDSPKVNDLIKTMWGRDQKTRAFMEQSPLAILIADREGNVIATNNQWCETWQCTSEQAAASFNVLTDNQFRDMGIETFFTKALNGEKTLMPDFAFDPKQLGFEGQPRWTRTHLFSIPDEDPSQIQVVLAQLDISTCMQCEERYQIVIDNANEAIMVIQDGIVKFFNQKALDIAGYDSQEDYLNKSFLHFVPPDYQPMIMDRHLRRQRGEYVDNFYQVKVVHKKGHIIWLQLTAVKIDWEGRPASLAFLYDITDHKKAEEQLLQYKNKLEHMVEERTKELKKALLEVRTLKGLIPVCASCKNIRDDKGYWKLMEDYIRTNSDADITHGLCPDCAVSLYPDLFKDEKDLAEYQQTILSRENQSLKTTKNNR